MFGYGMRGDSTPGPDALYSQGVIQTHPGAGLLAAANPGFNTIVLFKINPDYPSRLEAFGYPISSGGNFPVSVAFNSAGDIVCALNSGESNGIQCFEIDPQVGLITAKNTSRALGIDQTTPPVGAANTASQLIFSDDDTKLVVAVKGVDVATPGYLAWWNVFPDDSLSQNTSTLPAPKNGAYPFSLTPVPGRNAFLSADYAVGVDVFDLTNFEATAIALPGQIAACWSAYSSQTDSYYVTDTATGMLSELTLNEMLQPTLVSQYQFSNMSGMVDLEIASFNSTDFLYILMAGSRSITVLDLSNALSLKRLQTVDLVQPAASAGIVMNSAYLAGMAVYVKHIA